MDPSYDIPDGVQKAAEHVVREVIKEVHGPFFNSEVSGVSGSISWGQGSGNQQMQHCTLCALFKSLCRVSRASAVAAISVSNTTG